MVVLGYPGVQALDLVGPFEVFIGATIYLASQGRVDEGYSVTATDLSVASDGGIVVVGTIKGNVDLDGTSIVSAGGDDVVLATFSSSGQLVWASTRFGTATKVAKTILDSFMAAP